jgi:NDP-sugar pyrophosphorylase family protein
MKAMVLAAGLGTRLRPLTDDKPKALVEVAGRTLLEITLERLRGAGVREVIVNAHHFADQLVEYLRAHENFGMRVEVSREDVLLDTGGGLKQAAWFFRGEDEPFLVHNVDVVSGIDLGRMVEAHRERGALATLAVKNRETSRLLLFDGDGWLCGRRRGAVEELTRGTDVATSQAFCGIHVIGITGGIWGSRSRLRRRSGIGSRGCGSPCLPKDGRDGAPGGVSGLAAEP